MECNIIVNCIFNQNILKCLYQARNVMCAGVLVFSYVSTYTIVLFLFLFLFWNLSDSVVYFGTCQTVWYILELVRHCGIFWNLSDTVVYFVFRFILLFRYNKGNYKKHFTTIDSSILFHNILIFISCPSHFTSMMLSLYKTYQTWNIFTETKTFNLISKNHARSI
jgi:hypothetical protein